MELALHAGRAWVRCGARIALARLLVLPADSGVQLHVGGQREETGKRSVALYSRTGEGAWVQNATGELEMSAGQQASAELESCGAGR